VTLCLDTGHIAYCDGDSLKIIQDFPERIGYVHLKQVDPTILEKVRADRTGFVGAPSWLCGQVSAGGWDMGGSLELSAGPLAHPAPDPEALVGGECVLQTLRTDQARLAGLVALGGRSARAGKKLSGSSCRQAPRSIHRVEDTTWSVRVSPGTGRSPPSW